MAMEPYFSLDHIFWWVWGCLGLSALAVLWQGWPLRSRLDLLRAAPRDVPDKLPGLSVIVYASDNARALEVMLPSVLEQEYPGPYEVIVVNNGKEREVGDVVTRLQASHTNLTYTFVPTEARSLSRLKLALSLGIKAARQPYVLQTAARCRISSRRWAQSMAAPFAQGKEVVLGWATVGGLISLLLRFDEAASGAAWLTAALRGHSYRGTRYNLAFKRICFFDNKGFARSLNLHQGDDDLFIHQIATDINTAVVISKEAQVTIEDARPRHFYRDNRLNHTFTGRMLPKGPRRFFGFSQLMAWLWAASTAVGVAWSLPNMLPSCAFFLLGVGMWWPLCSLWGKTGRELGIRLQPWLVWWPILWRWIFSTSCRLRCGSSKRGNFTWIHR